MDTRSQMQAIVDRLTGARAPALPDPSDLDEPWQAIYHRATPALNRAEAEQFLRKITRYLPAGRQIARDLAALLPDDDGFHPFPSLHDISDGYGPIDWLWPSWIPRAMLTLFGAAPGAGKSLVALDLARRIISGEPFPDGAPVPCPGSNVLIVDAEGAPELLNQRARAWDIDRRRLFLMLAPSDTRLINLADPDHQIQLLKMCARLRPALVVIDSLAAATPHGETSLEGSRTILGALSLTARKLRPAMLVIHHLRKGAGSGRAAAAPRIAAEDLRGSSYLSAAARSVLALSVPPQIHTGPLPPQAQSEPQSQSPPALDRLRRLEVVKTNLCRQPPPLGLFLEEPSGESAGLDPSVPILRYTEYSEPPAPPTHLELCARWLLDFLAAGEPARPADVIRAAREIGFSRPTVYRARQILAGAIVDLGTSLRDPNKRWTLAPSPSPPPGAPQD